MINKGHSSISLPSASLLACGMSSFSVMLAKKCERLATAEYLVTSFLPELEPLKARLRTLSLDLVRDASRMRHSATTNEALVMDDLRTNISETLSLLELAFINGLVSEMNFSILKREYVSLRDMIDIKKASRESRSDTILGDGFFDGEVGKGPTFRSDVSGAGTFAAERSSSLTSISIGHSKGHDALKDITKENTMSDRKTGVNVVKAATSVNKKLSTFDSQHTGSRINSNVSKNIGIDARHSRILKLVKDKRTASIKDIMEHFPEISEKTIQRDLVSFIESGVLKKTGDRRWSRYSLA